MDIKHANSLTHYIVGNNGPAVQDIAKHGIDGGFNGLIYYWETGLLFDKFKSEIIEYMNNSDVEFYRDIILSFTGSELTIKSDSNNWRQITELNNIPFDLKNNLVWDLAQYIANELTDSNTRYYLADIWKDGKDISYYRVRE